MPKPEEVKPGDVLQRRGSYLTSTLIVEKVDGDCATGPVIVFTGDGKLSAIHYPWSILLDASVRLIPEVKDEEA